MDAQLTADERDVAERLLREAWGRPVRIDAQELLWGRPHVVRVADAAGRTAVVKRPRRDEAGRVRAEALEVWRTEWAGLAFLAGMPEPVAPGFFGGSIEPPLLLMEELPPGRALADSLLDQDPATATGDLLAYARGLAAVHAWSRGRGNAYAAARAAAGLAPDDPPRWLAHVEGGIEPLARLAGAQGDTGFHDDCAELLRRMQPHGDDAGFVHADPCPDNVRLVDGRLRLFDFELSSFGWSLLDATYVVAPFPSCWCWAPVPAEVSQPALEAYRDAVVPAGTGDFQADVAVALATWVVARGGVITRVLERDDVWGTTTKRPRLLQWMDAFLRASQRSGALPHLAAGVARVRERCGAEWDVTRAAYPAFAEPGGAAVAVPDWWRPGL